MQWSVTTVMPEGRMLAAALMVAGVGLFGAMSGIVASLFLGHKQEQDEILVEVKTIRAELAQLRAVAASPDVTEKREGTTRELSRSSLPG